MISIHQIHDQKLSFIALVVGCILVVQVASAKPIAADRAALRQARIEFEKKNFKKALVQLESIPQVSDYWPEALEERAWAHVHLKEHDQALAHLKTLFAPPLKSEIGAEPYLLSALIQLRLCNYNEIFKVMKRFKGDVRPRHEAMLELAQTGESVASLNMLGRSREMGQISRASAGADLPNLPQLFYRDAKIQSAFLSSRAVNASDRFNNIITQRMQALAKRDVKDTETILRKMHLIEVEAVSRIYSQQNLADSKKTSAPIVRNANTLVFPDDDEDVWLDELDSYQVNAKGCPTMLSKGPKS